jgi:diacylglycerol kinase
MRDKKIRRQEDKKIRRQEDKKTRRQELLEFIRSRIRSFGYAFRGWGYVLRTQPNAWIHAVISTAVISVAIWLNLPARDWAVLIVTMALVWSSESMNTAIEAVVDLASPAHHPLAKAAKDAGAAAVLIAAIAAVLIGLLILGPPLWEKLFG